MVGRAAPLTVLTGALDDAVGGRGSVVTITGAAGVGKTRLAEELADHAARRRIPLAWGRGWPGGGAPPYWPWIDLVRSLGGIGPQDDLRALLGPRESRGQAHPSADPAQRLALFDATVSFLRSVATDGLLLLLDDLHAADEPTLHLLVFLARQRMHLGVLVIGTYRDGELSDLPGHADLVAQAEREGRRLELAGLSTLDVGRLIENEVGTTPDSVLLESIARATGGNPLYVTEVARGLAAGSAGAARGATVPVPVSIRSSVLSRLSRLTPAVPPLLSWAAVLGDDIDVRLLSDLAAVPVASVLQHLDEAAASNLVRPAADRPGHWRFGHDLVRSTLYEELGTGARSACHLEVARALQSRDGTRRAQVALIGHHYFEAGLGGDPSLAVQFLAEAAEQAVAALAPEEAVRLFEQAIAMNDLLPDADLDSRCRLLVGLGNAHRSGGSRQAALEPILESAAIARAAARPDLLGRAALAYAELFLDSGVAGDRSDPVLTAMLDEAVAGLPDGLPLRTQLLGRLAHELVWSAADEGRKAGAIDSAVRAARSSGDSETLLTALPALYESLSADPDVEQRLTLAREVLALEEASSRALTPWGRSWLVIDLLRMGDVAALQAQVGHWVELGRHNQHSLCRWYPVAIPATVALLRGQFERWAELVDAAASLDVPELPGLAEAFGNGQRFVSLFLQGQAEQLVHVAEAAYHDAGGLARMLLAFAYAQAGRTDEAAALLQMVAVGDFAGLPRDYTWPASAHLAAQVAVKVGDSRSAVRLGQLLSPYRGADAVSSHSSLLWLGPVAYSLALVAASTESADTATELFDEALTRCLRVGATPWAAMIRRDRAAVGGRSAQAPAVDLALASLRRTGDLWTVTYDGTSTGVKHSRGMDYLATLLAAPQREFHALDLAASGARAGGTVSAADLGELLDPQARAAYKRRIIELRSTQAEAEEVGDALGVERARTEIEALAHELASAVGLGGRSRTVGSSAERARQAVSKAIRTAVTALAVLHPALGEHLRSSVRTGTFCSYDPIVRVDWEMDGPVVQLAGDT